MGKVNNKIKDFFHYNNFDAERSVTSWFISPRTLLIIRGIIFLYSWIVLITEFVNTTIHYGAKTFFVYLTELSFVGVTAYFTAATYHSYRYVTKNGTTFSLQNQHQILSWSFWLLYHTIVHVPTVIVLTYWVFLSNYYLTESIPAFNWWLNVSVHGANFIFSMIELFLNRQIMAASLVISNLIIAILYTFLAMINYAVNSFWVYDFLDWSKGPTSAIWYIGLYAGSAIIFFLVFGLHLLRDYVGNRFGRYKDVNDFDDIKEHSGHSDSSNSA